MMNQKLINILFPIIGLIIFIYIIFDIGIEKIAYTFLTIPILYYLIALTLFVPRLFFTSYKWLIISKKQKFNFQIRPVPLNKSGKKTQANIEDVTLAMVKELEKTIRRYPQQYFWMHRRWKTTGKY